MICSNCGAENRPDRRFCLQCGTALARACTTCGAGNEPSARFCGNCGSPLEAPGTGSAARPAGDAGTGTGAMAAPAATAERRLVSVLFADLVGFTPFAEERDAEEVRDTLQRYFDLCRQVIERYGGTVEKFIGDAVMAVWGTPTAHEDDAERAVRAALELTDVVHTLGAGIEARAAVLSGEAAVTLGATDQGLLAGDLVNTAARLQSVAPAGTVLVGESTMRASSAALAFEPAGEQVLKGKSAPVPAWQALRVVAQRRGAGRSEALETPFVGRDEEFRTLRELLHLAGRDPRARLVSVTGPAGIGKSRLAWELEKYIDGVVESIYWHRGRCPAYGEGVSFWALGEMVRRRCGLAEGDDEATTRRRVEEVVAQYVVQEDERAWVGSALLALLGLEGTPQGGREMLFAAWRRFFEHIAGLGTTVLVFEDLHWADSGLLDFIDHLLDWSKSAPILVLTLARPELFDRRPDWGAGRRTFTALALDPLPDPAMREMLTALVPQLPEKAMSSIVERADGIPLYAVETVRMLLADGRLVESDGAYRPTRELGDLAVPESLRSLITSRLDALEPADRSLLQDASVLGQSFTVGILAALTGIDPAELEAQLRQLVRRELLTLEADPRSPERGQFGFVQSLTREVAYSTLARPERRARHLAAARHYEAVGGDEIAGVLAGHYLAAHEASAPGPEADAVAAQARVALRGAADRAAALAGHQQAAAYLEQALSVTAEAAERAALMERQAFEADLAGRYERAEAVCRSAIEIYLELGDVAGTARARGVLGTILIHAYRVRDAIAELEPAVADLPVDADPQARADALAKLARAYYRNLEPARSLEIAEQAMVLAEHHSLLRTLAEAMVSKGTALSMLSRQREASVLILGGMELARREGDVPTVLRGAANATYLVATYDSTDKAMSIGRDALELARTVGDRGQIVWQLGNVAMGTCHSGLPIDPVLAELDEALTMDLEPVDRLQLQERYFWPAIFRGRDVAADLASWLRAVDMSADPQTVATAQTVQGLWAIAGGDYRRASEHFEHEADLRPDYGQMSFAALLAAIDGDAPRTSRLLEKAESLPLLGRTDEGFRSAARGAVAAFDDRRDEALARFRDATRRMREAQDLLNLALVGLGMLRVLGPAEPEARAAGQEALAILENMPAEPLIAQVKAALGTPPAAETTAAGAAAETTAAAAEPSAARAAAGTT